MIQDGVTLKIGEVEKHTYHDFGLIMKHKEINAPVPQTRYVEVGGRNGAIDFTEVLTGNVRYNMRSFELEFMTLTAVDNRTQVLSDFENFAHGQKVQFIFDDDEAFYYLGRIESIEPDIDGHALVIDVKGQFDPYKYNITTSAEDWLWDPFDFEEGVINETANLVVDGTLTYTLIASQRWENPIIISDSAMVLQYDNGANINIVAGSQVLYNVIITAGEHTFKFTGHGTVTINYVGGML